MCIWRERGGEKRLRSKPRTEFFTNRGHPSNWRNEALSGMRVQMKGNEARQLVALTRDGERLGLGHNKGEQR